MHRVINKYVEKSVDKCWKSRFFVWKVRTMTVVGVLCMTAAATIFAQPMYVEGAAGAFAQSPDRRTVELSSMTKRSVGAGAVGAAKAAGKPGEVSNIPEKNGPFIAVKAVGKLGSVAVRRIHMADRSGRYLEQRGKRWYLCAADRQPLSGVQKIVPVQKGKKIFEKGYYFFEADGRLCTKKDFHALVQTVGKRKFNGVYYFGGRNGKLYTKKGWITVGKKRYYLTDAGKRVTNKWKSGYYLQANGVVAKSKKTPDGTWVGFDGRKCKKNEVRLGSLKQKISSMVSRYSGSWSVYVKDLETGDVVNINDRSMYSASTIKAFVMASVYNEIYQGRLRETGTVQSLLRSMITVSSNDAYNSLVRYQGSSFVSGAAVVNRYLKANGYDKTGCHHTLHPSASASVGDGGRNMVSARDSGVLLERIYKGKCVSKKYSQKMLSLLRQQQRKWKIPAGLPYGVKSANKTGETSTTQHDMAIVFGKKKDYVICVFSTGCGEGSAITGIRNVSRMVYNYLNE